MLKNALIEAGKELVRNTIMAIVPVILSGVNLETGAISVKWPVVLAVALYTILTGVDRFMHILGNEKTPKVDKGKSFGLVRI